MGGRSGRTHVDHIGVSTSGGTQNSGAWTKAGGYDNLIANGSARHEMSVWYYVVQSGDDFTDIDFDDGSTNNIEISCRVYRPSATYGFVFKEFVADGSGTADWSGTGSGSTASLSGNDLLEIGIATCRTESGTEPTTGNVSLSPHTDGTSENFNSGSEVNSYAATISPSTAAGSKSTTVTSDGSGNEGVVSLTVFGDT